MDEIRVITWTVSDDGLELLPEAPQFGGVQGEDNATLVRFAIGEGCPIAKPEYSLYIEATDATGAWDSTDRLSIEDGYVSYMVPLAWTQHGGHTTLRLQAKQDGQTVYTLAGVLRFDNRATAASGRMTVFRTLIQEALEQLRAARAEFMASIEDHLDDTSENPVQNKVVTNEIRYVDELATDNGKRITAVSKRVSDLELYSDDIGRIREISERVSAVEGESLPDLEKRLTHVEDTMPIVDSELSATSENPVQNKAVNEAIGNMDQRLYALEQNGGSGVTVDAELDPESENPVQNKVVTEELAALQEYADRINEIAAQAEQVVREMNQDVTWLMGHEQAINDLQGYEHRITVLEGSVVKHSAQALTEAQKQQARANIGAVSDSILNALQDVEQILIPAMEERIAALEAAGSITVDDEMSYESTNPVQNKVVMAKIAEVGSTAGAADQKADEAKDTAADAKSIANTANNTAKNAQSAANNALNKALAVEEDLSEVSELVNDFNGDLGDINQRVGALENTDVVNSVNGQTGAVNLTAQDVGADKSGTANSAVADHNTKTDAHNDIRLLITALTTRLDALANSDDTTLDQMAEVVAYIKANRDLIEQVTTGKVSVADIVNNLTTNVTNKPLSAAQGVALKALIDAITVPTKLSELEADNNNCRVSYSEKSAWNAKSNFSGAYADLTGKPTIPTVPTKVSAFTNDAGYLTDYEETDPTVPSWAKAASKPSYTKSEVGLGNVDNVKQYSANNPPPYPVTSVNGKTGAVTVSVPTKTSQLTNDSGFLTAHQDISGKADKSSAETWTFTLEDGSTVTKKVVLA